VTKSSLFPIFASFFVIIASIIFVKPAQTFKKSVSLSPTPILTTIPSPSLSPTPDADYLKTYAKCGELPYIQQYTYTGFAGNISKVLWSPGCRFVAWSATIKKSFGSWVVSPGEGLFIYDLKTKKITRIYTPKSETDSVFFKKWLDDDHLIFHQDLNNTDNVYNMSTKTFYNL
jgi:hypothetical protein